MKYLMRYPLLALAVISVVFALACDLPGVPSVQAPSLPGLPGLPGAAGTATPAGPPGVYAASIRVEGTRGDTVNPTFIVTFQNTTGGSRTYKWFVKIFRLDNRDRSFGETAAVTTDIPAGESEARSATNWRVSPRETLKFVARVFGSDANKGGNPDEFALPDGSGASPELNFELAP